mgnify:CR=1 FL=1
MLKSYLVKKKRKKVLMVKQLWEKERNLMFWDLVREYKEDGYEDKEAKQLAKRDVNEVFEDKKDFVNDLFDTTLKNIN